MRGSFEGCRLEAQQRRSTIGIVRGSRRLRSTLTLSLSTKRSSAGPGCRRAPEPRHGFLSCPETVSGNQSSRKPFFGSDLEVPSACRPEKGRVQDDGPIPPPVSLESLRRLHRYPDRPKPGPRSGRACRARPPGQDRPDLQETVQGSGLPGEDGQWHTPGQR